MSNEFNPEGNPLPNPKSGDNLPDYGRDRGRQPVPTKGIERIDIFGGKPQSAADERVRNVQRGQYADFFARRFGRAITENEYPEHLRNADGAV